MKKIFILLLLTAVFSYSYAQQNDWTEVEKYLAKRA
jgi:hypothetical protein